MSDDKDIARIEAVSTLLQTRVAALEQASARADERINTHKDRLDKIETGQRNIIMAVIGIVITAIMRSIGFVK